ncbi:hypothetical protein TIFTF001_002271 [Ficus carica]|uniref:Nitrate regulatory gene2 protein n=1 Tax=Ficus carica TaxID=3494 RepID=A0AA87ZA93_FICCA|nr:hypothetical protein TIFTF001_002271 [Ficus carica]
MGCCYSRVEREETVSRCKSRRRYMKQLVKARHALSASHTMYLRSLRSTGAALLHFANAESHHHHHHRHHHHHPPRVHLSPPPPPPPPPPPMSPTATATTDTWTTSVAASPALPPPPPPPASSTWDFWDPFAVAASTSATEDDWEEEEEEENSSSAAAAVNAQGNFASKGHAPPSPPAVGSSELAVVVCRNSTKDFVEIIKELDEYLVKAGEAGSQLSLLLEVPSSGFSSSSSLNSTKGGKVYSYGWGLSPSSWTWGSGSGSGTSPKMSGYGKIGNEMVKSELACGVGGKLANGKLHRIGRFMCMWRSMYECHQVQKHIVQQLKYLNVIPSTEPTSEIHRQATLQLELEVQQWHLSFCNMVKAQQDYIQSLMGWLRLSLFQFNRNSLSRASQESKIYSLCEEWNLAVDRIPDKVASEGIKSFLTVIHAIVVQQAEEQKQKKKSESVFKDLEKKVLELRSLESKYGPYFMLESSGATRRNPVAEKRAKVEMWRVKAEEEKTKHEKSVSVTRAMTLNNLQMGLPHVFEGMVGFSSVCMQAFESVYNHTKSADQEVDLKRLMP